MPAIDLDTRNHLQCVRQEIKSLNLFGRVDHKRRRSLECLAFNVAPPYYILYVGNMPVNMESRFAPKRYFGSKIFIVFEI